MTHRNEQFHGTFATNTNQMHYIHCTGHPHVAVNAVLIGQLLQLRISMAINVIILQRRTGQRHDLQAQGVKSRGVIPLEVAPVQHGVEMSGDGADVHVQLGGDVRSPLGRRCLVEGGEDREGLTHTLRVGTALLFHCCLTHNQTPFPFKFSFCLVDANEFFCAICTSKFSVTRLFISRNHFSQEATSFSHSATA